MSSEEKETFEYRYSAKQQEEIRKIREKYIPREENKMEQLRRLDASATKPGMITAITLGTISVLILGIGMCCTMLWADRLFLPGVIIGIVGMVGMDLAYPLYNRITKRRRKELAPEIMQLTEELSQQK